MKYVLKVLLSGLLFCIALLSRAQLTDSVRCSADPTQTYALYIPQRGLSQAPPVVYCFDPHGSGILPVRKYKALIPIFDPMSTTCRSDSSA